MNYDLLNEAVEAIRSRWPEASPAAGMILGSGWSDVVEAFDVRDTIAYEEIPGLGAPGVVGHSGRLAWIESNGRQGFLFQGRRHWYEGEGWTPVAIPVFTLRAFGASAVLLTNAAGGIREGLHPGDLVILSDHINHMQGNPLIGPHDPRWGPRFPDQSSIYDASLRRVAASAGTGIGEALQEGVYLAASGPTYETPAEIAAYRALGADLVGMSTVPEAILANASVLRVAAISCVTNYAAGISKTKLSHEEVTETTQTTMPRMKALLAAFWEEWSHEPGH